MLVVWMDFCDDSNLRPSAIERLLFRQLHAPQFYLAGLPLAFFTRAQLQWFLKPLLELWGREKFDPEHYDSLTVLLGIAGNTDANRRAIDRTWKAEQRRKDRVEKERRTPERGGRVTAGKVEAGPQTGQGLAPEAANTVEGSSSPRDSADRVSSDPAVFLDRPEDFPIRSSNLCPTCQNPLVQISEPLIKEFWAIVEVECTHCDKQETVAFDLRQLR
jgi:hypothetical protein